MASFEYGFKELAQRSQEAKYPSFLKRPKIAQLLGVAETNTSFQRTLRNEGTAELGRSHAPTQMGIRMKQQWPIREAAMEDAVGLQNCMEAAYASYQDRMGGDRLPPMDVDY